MLQFIAKYWLEFVFGIIAAGATAFAKFFWKMYKEEKARQIADGRAAISEEIRNGIEQIHEASKNDDSALQTQIDQIGQSLETLRNAILVLYKEPFRKKCEEMLLSSHVITLKEFEEVRKEHETYNSLNGNSDGDALFELVKKKYENTLK